MGPGVKELMWEARRETAGEGGERAAEGRGAPGMTQRAGHMRGWKAEGTGKVTEHGGGEGGGGWAGEGPGPRKVREVGACGVP